MWKHSTPVVVGLCRATFSLLEHCRKRRFIRGRGGLALIGFPLATTSVLFFASGFAALLYQIAWQRMLFGWYGVDLDSVSAIVSIFMLGLGLGALVGGWLADQFQRHRILVFSLIELTIATFGIFS